MPALDLGIRLENSSSKNYFIAPHNNSTIPLQVVGTNNGNKGFAPSTWA